MKYKGKFWVLGGDYRHHWLSRQLAQEGYSVHSYGQDRDFLQGEDLVVEDSLEGLAQANCVLLPLPCLNKEGELFAPFAPQAVELEALLAALAPHQQIFGGQIPDSLAQRAKDLGLELQDYFTREELIIANAVPTAEGCLQIALERLPITLQEARVLILGYGRVAQATARRFAALGAQVTVAARRPSQLAQAQADGFATDHIHQLRGYLCPYHLLVNTVPHLVLGREELEDLEPSALIIDLASRPGGVDWQAAQDLERTAIHALSLPGKVAPATAGRAILRTILPLL